MFYQSVFLQLVRYDVVGNISPFHGEPPGSIPGIGIYSLYFFLKNTLIKYSSNSLFF